MKTMIVYNRRMYKGHANEKYSSYVKNVSLHCLLCVRIFQEENKLIKLNLIAFARVQLFWHEFILYKLM